MPYRGRSPGDDGGPRQIAVGIVDPAHADDALAFAFEEAALRRSRLTAVHIVYQFPIEAYRPGPEITLADGRSCSPPRRAAPSHPMTTAPRPNCR
jgi:hypothetical protein